VQVLRDIYSQSKFWLVAVYADYGTRWKRIDALGFYPNENVFKRDDSRDSEEDDPLGQSVQRCVYEADYVFKNVETLEPKRIIEENLAKKLREQISVMKGEVSRNPTNAEVSMATAVSQSHASRCLRRKVGALIVDEEKGIPVSVGYNDNPIGMESCFTLYNGLCYKDMIMETKLEAMGPLFCPECGKEHDAISRPWKCDGEKKDGTLCRCNFKSKFFPSRNMELCTAIHAEERAIRSLGGRTAEGCTLYVNTFPCLQCARYIKDADIRKVVYVEAYPVPEAVDFMKTNKIEIEPFEGFKPRVFNQVFKQIE
jgi:deoxycytidylate deaminase